MLHRANRSPYNCYYYTIYEVTAIRRLDKSIMLAIYAYAITSLGHEVLILVLR